MSYSTAVSSTAQPSGRVALCGSPLSSPPGVRSILFKLTKGDAPDIEQMNARVRKMLEGAIQSDGIEELFETGKHISVDIFSDEYMDKINAIQLPNTKIKILQRLLSQAIDEFKKVNKIMGVEFADRLKKVVDEYNNRRRDEAYANEVLDDVAEQLAQLLSELKTEKNSFKNMGIDYEEKAFYDILKAVYHWRSLHNDPWSDQ